MLAVEKEDNTPLHPCHSSVTSTHKAYSRRTSQEKELLKFFLSFLISLNLPFGFFFFLSIQEYMLRVRKTIMDKHILPNLFKLTFL